MIFYFLFPKLTVLGAAGSRNSIVGCGTWVFHLFHVYTMRSLKVLKFQEILMVMLGMKK